ncbi:amino acid adenylation domain-containing protein [uncultured Jatrophihabitans sp.]|uniref:non-ribosomal peptide synthetase n=1 Tax=uncultured Jatrophihabitans sp. TaxID=1610747 RepID=UPI0035CA4707
MQGFELSLAQRDAYRLDAGSSSVNRVRVPAPAHRTIADLRETLVLLSSRLEILRTSFSQTAGAPYPVQVISPDPYDVVELGPKLVGIAAPGTRAAVLGVELSGGVLDVWALRTVADHESLLLIANILNGVVELTDDNLQYADYAGWESEQREADTPERRLAADFWPAAAESAGPADPAASPTLAEVASRRSASAELWLSAWVAVLERDQVLAEGAPAVQIRVSGRGSADVADAVGPFARSVPLAVPGLLDLPAADAVRSVAALLGQADRFLVYAPQTVSLVGFSHYPAGAQDVPPDARLVAELVLVGDGPLSSATVASSNGEDVADRLAAHLGELVSTLDEDSARTAGDANMLPSAELERLVAAGTAAEPAPQVEDTLLEAFERQAAQSPDAPALDDGTTALTFAELDAAANATAAGLRASGAGSRPVAIVTDRTVATVVSMLAAWKCGQPFQPLGPGTPAERLERQLARSGADVVLAAVDHTVGSVPTYRQQDLAQRGATLAADLTATTPEDPAYLLATSGSTGEPKIVVVRHRNAVAYARGVADRLRIGGPGSRLGVVTSLSTDLAYTMVLPALFGGGSIRLLSDDELSDVTSLDRVVRAESIAAVKLTPSLARALLAGEQPVLSAPLVVLGGEALEAELVESLYAAGVQRVVNHYGPTETTVGATIHDVARGAYSAGPVPIGRPLPGVRTFVLDARQHLAPFGVSGQLAIGGSGVSAGYLGDPDTTATVFTVFDDQSVYLTGDSVRLDDGGHLVYLGRGDGQVKIRGHRVELAEIESTLRGSSLVKDAAVLVDPDDPDGDRLVAYVSGDGGTSTDELRSALGRTLPDHMIPAQFVTLADLPRMANGKLDRAALPRPADVVDDVLDDATPPANDTESALLAIWSDVLLADRLGVEDDFFFVGGHSLLATRIMARARSTFGVELPLHLIFSYPTVRTMSVEIDDRLGAAAPDVPLSDLIASIENMDEDEARRLLDRELGRTPGTE